MEAVLAADKMSALPIVLTNQIMPIAKPPLFPNTRPQFSRDLSLKQFSAYYWYKDELAAICRQAGLEASGTKAELQNRITDFLRTGKISKRSRRGHFSQIRKTTAANTAISLSSRLIPEGFKFNRTAREFFAKYFNVKKFSFTKEMAAALRDAEKRGDLAMTVAGLVAVYEKNKRSKTKPARQSAEEKTAQWNNFVRDFNRDARTRGMANRMQVAVLLWRQVRDRAGAKTYSPQLLDEFAAQIKKVSQYKT